MPLAYVLVIVRRQSWGHQGTNVHERRCFFVFFGCFKKRGRARHFLHAHSCQENSDSEYTKNWRLRIYLLLFTYYLVITPTTCRQSQHGTTLT